MHYDKFPTRNLRDTTTRHNIVLVKSLPAHIESSFFYSVHDHRIIWQQSYNEFYGGGIAQPKLYAAFSKNLAKLKYYVPHSKNGRPLLVYEAQPYSDFPTLEIFEQLLASMGYNNFNFVTVLMYAGEPSHISPHRDREQILGYENGEDVIATFVFGARRYDKKML